VVLTPASAAHPLIFFLVGDLCGFNPSAATHTARLQLTCDAPKNTVSEKKYRYSNQSHPAASSSAALPPCYQPSPAAPSRRQAPPSSSSRRERARSPQAAPAASAPRPSDAERASGRVRRRRQPGGVVIYHGSDSKATQRKRLATSNKR
jgi:hypothetical protein